MKPPRIIMRLILIFLASYILFLLVWIRIKDDYGIGMVAVASRVVTALKDVRYEYMTEGGDIIEATFSPLRHGEEMLIDIPIKTSSYTFNAPLTLSIMAGLYPILRKRLRGYIEAVLILMTVHLIYITSLEAKELTYVFVLRGLESASSLKIILFEFLWGFTDNMVIRFEPFLIGAYLFLRFRARKTDL